jgi:hypothetical protein
MRHVTTIRVALGVAVAVAIALWQTDQSISLSLIGAVVSFFISVAMWTVCVIRVFWTVERLSKERLAHLIGFRLRL